tara:strand:- start:145 stop:300 length:156 start_codon:yes stop_codon:yes gene_type:complete
MKLLSGILLLGVAFFFMKAIYEGDVIGGVSIVVTALGVIVFFKVLKIMKSQ